MATQPLNLTEDAWMQKARERYAEMVKNGQIAKGEQEETPAGEQPQNSTGFELDWQGEHKQFASQQELATFMQAEIEKARRATLEEVTRQIPGQYVNPNTPSNVPAPPKIDIQELAKRMEKDPIDAWNYVDEARFGVKDVPGVIRELAQRLAAQEQYLAVNQFRLDHPEYQANEQNSKALLGVLQANNLPLTYDSLELAYNFARQKGLVQVQEGGEKTDFRPDEGEFRPTPRPVAGPPRLGRSGANTGAFDILSAAENMSTDDLAKYISSLDGTA